MSNLETNLTNSYTEFFYSQQMEGSFRSARQYAQILSSFFKPQSVIDFGCGRGTWLKAFKEIGAEKLVGLDGGWNHQGNMMDPAIEFIATDLNELIDLKQDCKFDLAISCEVAEHLTPKSSELFVKSITKYSDLVLFGAAFRRQGGQNHINERNHSYWGQLFLNQGYLAYDLFRPVFWGNESIDFWYQQNTFLFVRTGSSVNETLRKNNLFPLNNLAFLDCIHPTLFDRFVAISDKKIVQKAITFEETLNRHPRWKRFLRLVSSSIFFKGYTS